MKDELQEMLYQKYPKLFAEEGYPAARFGLRWGFECGDGWYDLIDELCSQIQAYCDDNGLQAVALQVKEKFGLLRFYVIGGDEFINNLIFATERESANICEECGSRDLVEIRDGGWRRTLCDACAGIERGYN